VRRDVFEGVRAEQVLQRSGLTEPAGCHVEADVLREQCGRGADRQRRDIFRAIVAVAAEPGDIAKVVEVAGAIRGDGAEIELAIAGKAGAAGSHYMRPPCRTAHPIAVGEGVDADAAVDDRDEVGVRQPVEDRPRPPPVDAAEDQVVVQRLLQTCVLADTVLERLQL